MYCKKCGKVIPDDSVFCQYCGEQLSDTQPARKKENKGLISRFQSLSKGWQICIMSYVCWVFLWIILCSTEAIYDDNQGICILLFVFVLPILALFIWYYLTRLRNKNREKSIPAAEQIKDSQKSYAPMSEQGYSISPLLLFANSFGKMQVKVERGGDGNTSSYCIFTNSVGVTTQVNFSESTMDMTAADISKYKEKLFVVQTPKGGYQLIKM